MTDQDRLAEIRQRRAAITPPPWEEDDFTQGIYTKDGDWRAEVLTDADRDFVAHAPDDIDWLLNWIIEAAHELMLLRAAHQAVWDAVPVVWDPADPHGVVFAKIATALVAAKMPEAPLPPDKPG